MKNLFITKSLSPDESYSPAFVQLEMTERVPRRWPPGHFCFVPCIVSFCIVCVVFYRVFYCSRCIRAYRTDDADSCAKHCDRCVCLSARLSQKLRIQISPNFHYAASFFDRNALCIPGYNYTTTLHTFNDPLSRTTRVSRYQKGKTNLDFTEARDSEWQRHQLGHMQVCTSLRTDNRTSTPPLSFTGRMPFLPPNQQCQCTDIRTLSTLDNVHNSQAQGLNLWRGRLLGGKRTVDINDE